MSGLQILLYIDQTYRALAARKTEHNGNIRKFSDEHTVIIKHIINNEYRIDWDNIQILEKETHYYKRIVLEILHIKTHKQTMNTQLDSENLNKIFDKMLIKY